MTLWVVNPLLPVLLLVAIGVVLLSMALNWTICIFGYSGANYKTKFLFYEVISVQSYELFSSAVRLEFFAFMLVIIAQHYANTLYYVVL